MKNLQLSRNPRFISPRTDFGFKKLLGSNESKESMIAFINSIYPELEVIDLDFLPTESQGESPEDHKSIFDVLCDTGKGEKVIVEMQVSSQKYFFNRALFYASRLITEEGSRLKDKHGRWVYDLSAVYVICVLNFELPEMVKDPLSQRCIWRYSLREDECNLPLPTRFHFTYIELPRFDKKMEELSGIQDKMLYLLRHLDMLEERPESFVEDFFSKIFSMAEFSNLSSEERNMYITQAMHLNDYYNGLDFAREQGEEAGLEKGLLQGRAEGMTKAKIETARNMKSKGISNEIISECTGLPLDQVVNL